MESFNHDVFISYAQVDDEPLIPGDDGTRWVRTFRQCLQTRLDKALGKKDSTRIWMDLGGLTGTQSVTPAIAEAVRSAAYLVVILSEGYLESQWCREEYDLFIEANGGIDAVRSRICVVQLTEIARDRWPPALRDLIGYSFFSKDPVTGVVSMLADPRPDPEERAYFAMLNKLRSDLGRALRNLRQQNLSSRAGASSQEAARQEAAMTIYVAESTPDLTLEVETITAYLKDANHRVLPERYYKRDPEEFEESARADLKKANLFVQLLGPFGSTTTDELPNGFEGLQWDLASACEVPCLRWRRGDMDLERIRNSDYRRFIQQPDVMAMDLEEFKRQLDTAIDQWRVRQERPLPDNPQDRLVLLNAVEKDQAFAETIGEGLLAHNLSYEVFDGGITPVDELMAAKEYRDLVAGYMVIYDGCPLDWLREQLRSLRRLVLGKRDRAPACGVVLSEDRPLPIRFSRLHVIDSWNPSALKTFVETLV